MEKLVNGFNDWDIDFSWPEDPPKIIRLIEQAKTNIQEAAEYTDGLSQDILFQIYFTLDIVQNHIFDY